MHHDHFAARVRRNQASLRGRLRRHDDFIVCGAGSSGFVVARRLAESPDVDVMLLEAGRPRRPGRHRGRALAT